MMEDDVRGSSENPYPNKLFNKPTAKGTPGVDVADGCVPDYKGKDVSAETFLAVLTGDTAKVAGKGNGKVLKSTASDNVFLNFADHGGGEIVEMPNGPYLHAKDLVTALEKMHTTNMYRKLVFYMEACNGGSMFANLLPTDINIFATTAASPSEPSWGTYCPPQDKVNGKSIGSCLGDLYSVNWMEDSDAEGEKKSLEAQYETVVKLTNKSHPQIYGTETWKSSDLVDMFQAHGSSNATTLTATAGANTKKAATDEFPKHAVDQRDIELLQVFYKYLRADEHDDGTKMTPTELASSGAKRSAIADDLIQLVQRRESDDALFANMLDSLATTMASSNGAFEPFAKASDAHANCIKKVTTTVQDKCGGFTSYSLKYHHLVVAYCSKMPQSDIITTVTATCAPKINIE